MPLTIRSRTSIRRIRARNWFCGAPGLGAITGDETEPPQQADLHTGVQVLVNNQPATVVYGGRGSSAGVDQINFVIPAGINGCKVSVAVMVKGVTGNITSMAVAPAGQATCVDTFGPLTADNLQKAITKGSLNLGGVIVNRVGRRGTISWKLVSRPIH